MSKLELWRLAVGAPRRVAKDRVPGSLRNCKAYVPFSHHARLVCLFCSRLFYFYPRRRSFLVASCVCGSFGNKELMNQGWAAQSCCQSAARFSTGVKHCFSGPSQLSRSSQLTVFVFELQPLVELARCSAPATTCPRWHSTLLDCHWSLRTRSSPVPGSPLKAPLMVNM